MNNFGFNSENPLMQYLRQYAPPAAESAPVLPDIPRSTGGGIIAYEINAKSDIEYIEPDKSGRKQIYICEKENKVYTGRYNHARREMDYRAYIDEGEMNLFPKADTSAEMTQIAEALVAVANKLDSLQGEIQEIKTPTPPAEDATRRPNGQFKKKGER